jgi:hypothetical protein
LIIIDDDREDLKHGSDWLVLAREDVEQRVALIFVRALVNDRLHYALAVMNGSRKIEGGGDRQIVDLNLFAMSFVYFECDEAGAITVSRINHRLTRAPVIAATVFDVPAFNLPVLSRHCRLPNVLR